VCGFYTRYLEIRPSGLPTAEQQAVLAPWFSDSWKRRLDTARRVQTQFRAENPGEKPPLVDGCLFASLFEGQTSFTVESATADGGVTRVQCSFATAPSGVADVIVLTREGPSYVIDDIEFGAQGHSIRQGNSARHRRAGE